MLYTTFFYNFKISILYILASLFGEDDFSLRKKLTHMEKVISLRILPTPNPIIHTIMTKIIKTL